MYKTAPSEVSTGLGSAFGGQPTLLEKQCNLLGSIQLSGTAFRAMEPVLGGVSQSSVSQRDCTEAVTGCVTHT